MKPPGPLTRLRQAQKAKNDNGKLFRKLPLKTPVVNTHNDYECIGCGLYADECDCNYREIQVCCHTPVVKVLNRKERKAQAKAFKAVKKVTAPMPWFPAWAAPVKKWRGEKGYYKLSLWLKAKGFQELGRGFYSTVFGKPGNDRVIKVTRQADNWIDYIRWAASKGYAGTYAPRVFSYKKYDDYSVSVMERMEECVGHMSYEKDPTLLRMLFEHSMQNDTAGILLDYACPGMLKFSQDFKERFGEERHDLHGGNMMVRHDGTFCVTDPVCGNRQTTERRLRAGDFSPVRLLRIFNEGCFR